jgi:hypothetical protein
MSAIEFVLGVIGRAEGLSDAQIAKLEADAPTFAALVQLSIDAKPIIAEAQALYEAAKPILARADALYQKSKPLIGQATAEWSSVAPDVKAILALVGAPSPPGGAGPGSQAGGGIGA